MVYIYTNDKNPKNNNKVSLDTTTQKEILSHPNHNTKRKIPKKYTNQKLPISPKITTLKLFKNNIIYPNLFTPFNRHPQPTTTFTSNTTKQKHHLKLKNQKSKNYLSINTTTFHSTLPQATSKNHTIIPLTFTPKNQYNTHHKNMASAYRPRHNTKHTYQHIYKLVP